MAYSYSVSSLSNYVQTVDSRTQNFNNKMAILQHLKLTHEKMSQSLYEKIVRFLKYNTHNERDKNEIIDNLPIGLRTTLIMEMYKPIINNFIFFKTYSSSDFIIRVILAFRPIFVMKNEKLVNEGDYIEEIVFVKRGTLSLELPLPVLIKDKDIENINIFKRRATLLNMDFPHYPLKTINNELNNQKPKIIDFNNTFNQQKTLTFVKGKGLNYVNTLNNNRFNKPIQQYVKIIEIRKNEHFGDILMFLNRRSPLSMKVKSKNAELFLLNKTDAVEISMNFPKIWSLIIKKSLFNMEQIERLINKALKFFFYQKQGKGKKGAFYQKDFTKDNIFVNCEDLYSSLSSQDCELKSIPSVSEQFYDTSEKNSIIPNFDKKTSNQNTSKSDKNSNDSDNNNYTFSNDYENTKSKRSFRSYSSEKSSEHILKSNRSNIKKNKTKKKKENDNFSDVLINETIKEANTDDEKDSVIMKKNKNRNSVSTEKKNVLTKIPTKGSKQYSDSDSEFNSSSSSLELKSNTGSKTKRGKETYNYFDFSSFSNNNNTLVYPFSKDEINNEEYPFENNNINTILENNNSIIKGFNGIVPKQYLYDNYLNQKSKLTNSIIKQKFSNHNFFFYNLSTSKFDFQIKSKIKENFEIKITSPKKEQIQLKIIKTASFAIHYFNKGLALKSHRNRGSYFKEIEYKKTDNNKLDINYSKSNAFEPQRKSMTNKSLRLKLNSDKKTNNNILNPKTKLFDSQKKTDNEKKNMPLFSEGTLDLIGKNIESSSLALNNPNMFYRNYFNQVVHADNERNKTVTTKLKEIEKIIQNGQKSRRQNTILEVNENNNNNKEIEVGEINAFKLTDEDIKST